MDPSSPGILPAFTASIPFAAGILLSRITAPSDPLIPAALTVLALGAIAVTLRRTAGTRIPLLACSLLGTGFTLESLDRTAAFLLDSSERGAECVVVGESDSEPVVSGRTVRFVVRARYFRLQDREVAVRTRVAVTIAGTSGDSLACATVAGIPVAVRGAIDVPPGRRNPGEFDSREYLRAAGIDFELFARGEGSIVIGRIPRGGLLYGTFVRPARRILIEAADSCVGGEEGEFLKGLLIGERGGISPATRDSFVVTGVAHILAVSGSNVVVIAAMIIALAGSLRIPPRPRALLVAAGLLWYMVLTGSQPPVVRATIMALAALFASAREEKINALNSLGFSGLVVLGADARALFDVGFQLSYAAVLSLALLTPVLLLHADRLLPLRTARRALRGIATICSASLAATLGTLPFIASSFGKVSIVGIAVNAAVVPASGLAVVLGAAMTFFYPVSHWCAGAFGSANWLLLKAILLICRYGAEVPLASVEVAAFSWIDASAYYVGLALAVCLLRGRRSRVLLLLFPFTLTLTLLQPPDPATNRSPGRLRVSFIDVGQGDAILLETPGGKVVLIDAGPALPGFDAGERTVVPFLRRRGIDSIDLFVLTHLHDDHAGGAGAVLRAFPVRMVAAPTGDARARFGTAVSPFLRPASGESIPIDSLMRVWVLWPEEQQRVPTDSPNANECSIVLQVRFRETALLFTGDSEAGEEKRMLRRFGSLLRSALLKVGHHGASAGTGPEFLGAVAPRIAVISAGRNNRFGHPSRMVVARLEECGADVRRTDRSGAVILESDGSELTPVEWR